MNIEKVKKNFALNHKVTSAFGLIGYKRILLPIIASATLIILVISCAAFYFGSYLAAFI